MSNDKVFIINEKLIKYDSYNSKLIFETKTLEIDIITDCCAGIYLNNDDELKKFEGTFIDRIEIRETKSCDFFWVFDKNNDVIFQEPFYESNNGYYSPSTSIILYDNERDKKLDELEKQLKELSAKRKEIYSTVQEQIYNIDIEIDKLEDKKEELKRTIIDELDDINGEWRGY